MTKLRGDDMNHIEWLKEVDEKKLDDKKEQTKYKIDKTLKRKNWQGVKKTRHT